MLKKIATAVFIILKHSTSSPYINVARNCILLSPSLAVWVLEFEVSKGFEPLLQRP